MSDPRSSANVKASVAQVILSRGDYIISCSFYMEYASRIL